MLTGLFKINLELVHSILKTCMDPNLHAEAPHEHNGTKILGLWATQKTFAAS